MINTTRPLEINPLRNSRSLVAQGIWVKAKALMNLFNLSCFFKTNFSRLTFLQRLHVWKHTLGAQFNGNLPICTGMQTKAAWKFKSNCGIPRNHVEALWRKVMHLKQRDDVFSKQPSCRDGSKVEWEVSNKSHIHMPISCHSDAEVHTPRVLVGYSVGLPIAGQVNLVEHNPFPLDMHTLANLDELGQHHHQTLAVNFRWSERQSW